MNRKTNRLYLQNYNHYQAYYLTLTCARRERYLSQNNLSDFCLGVLRSLSHRFQIKIWSYCFMPDHLHLLVESNEVIKFVKTFKQITGYYFKQLYGQSLWQKSFYDHILRSGEDISEISAYILNNPVRAGLVSHYLDYPYSGSFEIKIHDFVENVEA